VGGVSWPKKLKILTLCPAAVSKEMPTVLTNANPFVNSRLSAPRNVLVPVISLPLMTPVMASMAQTPVLAVGDASIVPLPGKGTPPSSGAGPVSDQSKTSA
jgi:ABC-type transport system involved in cytochrome c biogenesis permease component